MTSLASDMLLQHAHWDLANKSTDTLFCFALEVNLVHVEPEGEGLSQKKKQKTAEQKLTRILKV